MNKATTYIKRKHNREILMTFNNIEDVTLERNMVIISTEHKQFIYPLSNDEYVETTGLGG
jgi:hypothetical protein